MLKDAFVVELVGTYDQCERGWSGGGEGRVMWRGGWGGGKRGGEERVVGGEVGEEERVVGRVG